MYIYIIIYIYTYIYIYIHNIYIYIYTYYIYIDPIDMYAEKNLVIQGHAPTSWTWPIWVACAEKAPHGNRWLTLTTQKGKIVETILVALVNEHVRH